MNHDRDVLFDVIELIETINRHRPDSEEALWRRSSADRNDPLGADDRRGRQRRLGGAS